MFDVTVTNNSSVKLTGSDGKEISPSGGTWQWSSQKAGSAVSVQTPFGPLGLLDIGDAHVGGDGSETWGVLIGYQGVSVVGRYEGQGTLDVAIDLFLQAGLAGMDLREVELVSLVLPGEVAAAS